MATLIQSNTSTASEQSKLRTLNAHRAPSADSSSDVGTQELDPGPPAGLPEQSYEDLRYRVFLAFTRTTAGFSTLMFITEVFVRGLAAWQTLAFAFMAGLFVVLSIHVARTQNTEIPTLVALGTYFLVFALMEAASTVPAVGIRVATLASPVAIILLSGVRPAVVFYLLAVAQAVFLAKLEGDATRDALTILHIVGSAFVGGVLLAMAWAFDRARRHAMDLAQARERDLIVALKHAKTAIETRSDFLANMSHEIRTPMNGVIGLSRLLADEPLTESQRHLAETVVSSGQSLLQILDDILDLSKLDAGALLIDPKAEQPDVIARQVLALMASHAHESGLSLSLDVSSALPSWVHLDGHRFRQVLTNLVGNAVKFTSEGGVRVRVDYREQTLYCEVEDTGIGMEPALQEQVFRPFLQADSGTARRFGGTGLGLAICKRLCELMNGNIGTRSKVGVGSTFWFELPAPAVDPPVEFTHAINRPLQPLRVLVAEDNKVNQLVVERFLRRLGVDTRIVDNGAEAVDVIQRETFDVILMDRHMPKLDGLEATRRIRRLEGPPGQTPVIALTASVMAWDRKACLEAGMNDLLPKPVEMSTLEQTLRRYAGSSSSPPIDSSAHGPTNGHSELHRTQEPRRRPRAKDAKQTPENRGPAPQSRRRFPAPSRAGSTNLPPPPGLS